MFTLSPGLFGAAVMLLSYRANGPATKMRRSAPAFRPVVKRRPGRVAWTSAPAGSKVTAVRYRRAGGNVPVGVKPVERV